MNCIKDNILVSLEYKLLQNQKVKVVTESYSAMEINPSLNRQLSTSGITPPTHTHLINLKDKISNISFQGKDWVTRRWTEENFNTYNLKDVFTSKGWMPYAYLMMLKTLRCFAMSHPFFYISFTSLHQHILCRK